MFAEILIKIIKTNLVIVIILTKNEFLVFHNFVFIVSSIYSTVIYDFDNAFNYLYKKLIITLQWKQ